MENKTKKTKKPVDLSKELEMPSFFKIPKEVKAEAEAKGLETKWLNDIQLSRSHGYHRSGWKRYKFEGSKSADGKISLEMGEVDAEGFVRRGDLVVGARPVALGDQFRARIEKKNQALQRFTKSAAEEMKERIKGAGRVHVGYEHDDGEAE